MPWDTVGKPKYNHGRRRRMMVSHISCVATPTSRRPNISTAGTTMAASASSSVMTDSIWAFATLTNDGMWHMTYERADQLCHQAALQSKYQTPDEESSVEVSVQLSRLESQLKEMKATVGIATSLNSEADKVCVKLCEIAETLV